MPEVKKQTEYTFIKKAKAFCKGIIKFSPMCEIAYSGLKEIELSRSEREEYLSKLAGSGNLDQIKWLLRESCYYSQPEALHREPGRIPVITQEIQIVMAKRLSEVLGAMKKRLGLVNKMASVSGRKKGKAAIPLEESVELVIDYIFKALSTFNLASPDAQKILVVSVADDLSKSQIWEILQNGKVTSREARVILENKLLEQA